MEYLVYTNTEGSVAVVSPAPKEDLEKSQGPMTQEEYESFVIAGSIPEGNTTMQHITAAQIPSDRWFRAAWRQNGASIKIDMSAARIIQENKIRAARDVKWEDFDTRYVAAQRDGLDLTILDAERQTLKDVPQVVQSDIDTAATPDILKEIWPTGLDL